MSRTLRLGLCALGLALPCLASLTWAYGSAREIVFAAEALPHRVGDFESASSERLTSEVLEQLGVDAYVFRGYAAPEAAPVWLYAGFYTSWGRLDAHSPDACYPAQGWDIVASESLRVGLGDGHELVVELREAVRDRQRQAVLFWFQPAARWPGPASLEQLRRVVDALAERPQYAFVRLSTPITDAGVDDARERLVRFARELAPDVRAVVETGS